MPILSNFPSGGGTGGIGMPLAGVTNIQFLAASGKVYVKWVDPEDLVVAGSTLAAWGGTLLVRKAGSAPVSRRDGVIVLDSKTKNAYQDSYFFDSGLTDGVTYYYRFFPYSTTGTYTNDENSAFNITPAPVPLGNVSGITTAEAGNGKMSIMWTDPAATVVNSDVTVATWASTVVAVKAGGYAISPDDPDAAYTFISTTRNAYASSPLIVTGLTNGETYYISLFPMSTDGAVNTDVANRKTGVANRIVVLNTPSQIGSLTYNGNSQTPMWNGYNSDQIILGGDTSGINAGSYTATFALQDDYMWADGSTTVRSVNWSIERATISVPTNSSNFTYDGSQKSPVWTGYDSSKMTLGGTSSAMNAGTYTATFTPTANYKWDDGTTTAKNVTWSIAQAAGSLSLDKTEVTLNASNLTAAVTVTRPGDGAITASSSDTNVATVGVSGNIVTISQVNQTTGTATITIKVATGTNYTAPADKTVSVNAQFLPVKGTALNDCTWADIRQVSDAELGPEYWNVGDRKSVLISGTIGDMDFNTTLYVYILGFDHNSAREGKGIQFGTFKSDLTGGKDVALCDDHYNSFNYYDGEKVFNINHWGTSSSWSSAVYGGWKACDARYDILGSTKTPPKNYGRQHTSGAIGYNAPADTATDPVPNTLMAALPSDLRAVMKPITKYTDNSSSNTNSASNVTSSIDYLPLMSVYEVNATDTSGQPVNSYEKDYQKIYDYYSAGNSMLKYNSTNINGLVNYHTRCRPAVSLVRNIHIKNTGNYEYGGANTSYGLAPVFMV